MKERKIWNLIGLSFFLVGGVAMLFQGCTATGTGGAPGKIEATDATFASKGGSQLWGENCGRCHNVRDPSSLSDPQWEVVALHMRIRANLTAQEHEAIAKFLKASN